MTQPKITPNQVLQQERLRRHWSQREMAAKLGTSFVNISRWERGITVPSPYFRQQLCELFHKTPQELGLLSHSDLDHEKESAAAARFWHVPYPRNPFFTGREELLQTLHEQLHREHKIALGQSWAISGLGGIGKTQVALEYVYRYVSTYTAIFWISAETSDTLLANTITLAEVLNLPERNEQDQQLAVRAVHRWLDNHQGWLLVCDNVEDLALLQPILSTVRQGSILVTTRLQAVGVIIQRIQVDPMTPQEGTTFLLQRSKLLFPGTSQAQVAPADVLAAQSMVEAMDGLPLALDQVGAYIEETKCSLSDYVQLYQQRRSQLLERRGYSSLDHPTSIQTTLSLAFEQVQQRDSIAKEVLYLCAFLAPEAIPEEVLMIGISRHLGQATVVPAETWALDEAFMVLGMYSLVYRDTRTHTLSLHRLVQVVLQNRLSKQERAVWLLHIITALCDLFPEIEYKTWQQCERLIPHIFQCIKHTASWDQTHTELAALLLKTGRYLAERDRYPEAEPLLHQALQIRENVLEARHPDVAEALYDLAILYRSQGKYEQSRLIFHRALDIWEQTLGSEHPYVAKTLYYLATLYRAQSKYQQAETFHQRALDIQEQTIGPEHPDIAQTLHGLGAVFRRVGKMEQAKAYHLRALRIREKALGVDHPSVASSLCDLALVLEEQGKDEQAEAFYQQALHIKERTLGKESSSIVPLLHNLANLYTEQGKLEQAEPLYQRSIHLWEKALGSEHPNVAYPLHGLASLYAKQGKTQQAEDIFQRTLRIWEQAYGMEHPDVTFALEGLAGVAAKQGKHAEAEALYQRSLRIREQILGMHHPYTAIALHEFAGFYQQQGDYQKAATFYQRALNIREEVLGSEHPKTIETRAAYTKLLQINPTLS